MHRYVDRYSYVEREKNRARGRERERESCVCVDVDGVYECVARFVYFLGHREEGRRIQKEGARGRTEEGIGQGRIYIEIDIYIHTYIHMYTYVHRCIDT